MRQRVLFVITGLLAIVAVWSNTRHPRGIDPPPPRVRQVPRAGMTAMELRVPSGEDLRLTRNLFEYADGVGGGASPGTSTREATPSPSPSGTPPPLRLVGIVHDGKAPRAALVIDGEVLLGKAGEDVLGYTVVSIDEERVVVRSPQGESITLSP